MGNVFAFNTSPDWTKIAASSDPITGMVRSHVGFTGIQARKSQDGFPDFKRLGLLSTISEMMELIPAEERFLFYKEYATPGANQVDFIPLASEIFSTLTDNETVIHTPRVNSSGNEPIASPSPESGASSTNGQESAETRTSPGTSSRVPLPDPTRKSAPTALISPKTENTSSSTAQETPSFAT
jgi:hypothetical protein